jgi:hypothetical protein
MSELAQQILPPPKAQGVPVTDALIAWINQQGDLSVGDKRKAVEIIEGRRKYGMNKYGQLLMTDDGRCTAADAVQEAGDLLQYAFKARMNGELTSVRDEVKPVLVLLIKLLLS